MGMGPLKSDWYGIKFATPMYRPFADLTIWQRHKEPEWQPFASAFKNPIGDHYLQANRDLFTPRQLRIHPWFERCTHSYTGNRKLILLGSAASGKSFFTGWTFLLELSVSIGELYAYMVSTDKAKLRQRSFASAVQCLQCLKANRIPVPLKFVSQACAIVPTNTDENNMADVKSQLVGIAISEGSEQDAKAAAQGVHLPRVLSCADEFENMGSRAKVFLDAQANLRMGAVSYRCVLLFNPQSLNSPGCTLATPDIPGGWTALDPDKDMSWETKTGYRVERFDAFDSPALKDTTLTFLPTKESVEEVIKDNSGNVDAPNVWAMCRGFPRLSTEGNTVLSESELIYHKVYEDEPWRGNQDPIIIAGFDPAFTSEGDEAVLQIARVGHLEGGTLACKFEPKLVIPISASSKVPVVYQLVGGLKELYQDRRFKLQHLAIDDSGTQSVADVVAKEIGEGFMRCNFGRKASDSPVTLANHEPASKQFGNAVTEYWGVFAEYVRHNQIRNLPREAGEQFSARQYAPKRYPRYLETKKTYKQRTSRKSPDSADACALCGAVMRFVLGIRPGASVLEPMGPRLFIPEDPLNMARVMALNNLKSNYGITGTGG